MYFKIIFFFFYSHFLYKLFVLTHGAVIVLLYHMIFTSVMLYSVSYAQYKTPCVVGFLNIASVVYRSAQVGGAARGRGHHTPLAAHHLQHMQFKLKPSMLKHFSPVIL